MTLRELPYIDDDQNDPHLYTKGPLTPRWAQRVKEHQRRLMRSLRGGTNQSLPVRPDSTYPLPRSIEDLRHSPGRARDYTTAYRGVIKRRWHPGFVAFVPPGYGFGRRKVGGIFPTEEDAAQAVLEALNPIHDPTPPEPPMPRHDADSLQHALKLEGSKHVTFTMNLNAATAMVGMIRAALNQSHVSPDRKANMERSIVQHLLAGIEAESPVIGQALRNAHGPSRRPN